MLSAVQYHEKTSYDRRAMYGHGLDWGNQPRLFKTYPHRMTIPLPPVSDYSGPYLSQMLEAAGAEPSQKNLEMTWLTRVIWATHTVTARARHSGGDFYYRSVASAGALYPFELYVGVCGLDGLADGLYHHSLGLNALTCLRKGDITKDLKDGLSLISVSSPLIVFFLTAIFYRSAWKYRDRAYRYHLLDTGHLAENLVLAMAAEDQSFTLRYDFKDGKVNAFLGIDSDREVCLAVSLIQGADGITDDASSPLEPLSPGMAEASRVSPEEKGLSLIRQMHGASSRPARAPREALDMNRHVGLSDSEAPVPFVGGPWPEVKRYGQVLVTRRSKRNFIPQKLGADAFEGLVSLLCWDSVLGREDGFWAGRGALSVGVLCGGVEGKTAGFYLLDPEKKTLSLGKKGRLTGQMSRICLDQAWLSNSAIHVIFLSNLKVLENAWGARGYRYALLSAGRLGQRLYLGATSMGLGCCGIGAFYDDEARQLLGVNENTRMLYLVAVGPVKR